MMISKTAIIRVLVLTPLLSGLAITGSAAPSNGAGFPAVLDSNIRSDSAIASVVLGTLIGERVKGPAGHIHLAQANLPPVDNSLTSEQAYAMGVNYGFGRNGYPKDPRMAARLYNQAARRGHTSAMYNLALAYRKGFGVPRNYNETIRLYRKAIAKGHKGSMNNMGFMYENGYSVPRDNQQAMRYYRMAADRGHKLARDNIARIKRKLASGGGSGGNTSSGSNWRSLPAYDRSLTSVQAYNLGLKYRAGRDGYPRNNYTAARLYGQAARQGNASAMYNLALLYRKGEGVRKDYRQTIQLYRLAIAKNHSGAINNMGYMYEKGFGVPKDRRRALEFYRRAADRGSAPGRRNFARLGQVLNSSGGGGNTGGNQGGGNLPPFDRNLSSSAAYNLGRNYYYGRNGHRRDYYAAARLYHQAAISGHRRAQNGLAVSYHLGKGVPKNYYEAMRCYRRSADRGSPGSQYGIGLLYHKGHGVPKNYSEALRWYRKSAAQGFAAANNNLGYMYENGFGVRRSIDDAVYYYRLAAAKGHALAKQNLRKLRR